jgi:hypothetical protein
MLRMGSLRALDPNDYDPEEQSFRIQHYPKTDTPPPRIERESAFE